MGEVQEVLTCGSPHLLSSQCPTRRPQPEPPQASLWGRDCSEICAKCCQPGSTWSARSTGWSKARPLGRPAAAFDRSQSHSGQQIWTADPSFSSDPRPCWSPHLLSGARRAAGPLSCPASGTSGVSPCPPPLYIRETCCSGAALYWLRSRRWDVGEQSETWLTAVTVTQGPRDKYQWQDGAAATLPS